MVARCWEAARRQPRCCNGSPHLQPSSFAGARLVCPQGVMFQQEEATDAQPEQGNHHASEVATVALPSPGRAKAAVRWPTGTASSKVRLGTWVQYGEGALCSSAGRAETHWLGEGVLGSWDLSVLALVAEGGGQGLGPPAAGVALRCYQQWEPGVGERQGFLQAPSFAVIMASVPALC